MHLAGEPDDAAASETATAVVTVAAFFVSPEAAPGVQLGGGKTPAPQDPALPWCPFFQNACTTSFGRNGRGNHADTHTLRESLENTR